MKLAATAPPETGIIMLGIGQREIFIFLVIALILFGPTKLPQLARAIGKSLREFKDSLSGVRNDFEKGLSDEEEKSGPALNKEPVENAANKEPRQKATDSPKHGGAA